MTIYCNGQPYQLPSTCNLFQAFNLIFDSNAGGKAIAINQKIIPKLLWEETLLKEGDDMLVITASQGG